MITSFAIEQASKIRASFPKRKKIVLVTGNFNVIHPGHLRLLNFACDCGDLLVVALSCNNASGVIVSGDLRLEGVKAIGVVDHAFLLDCPLSELINTLRPEIIVKGKEYDGLENSEKYFLDAYGGKLLFASGEVRFSSLDLLHRELYDYKHSVFKRPYDYISRHQIKSNRLAEIVRCFKDLRVMVFGDLIVDEYITCDPIGMSQEDPTVVVTPIHSDSFIGGASIVAAHASGLGAKVRYFSVIGRDAAGDFAKNILLDKGVIANLLIDDSRPTTLKLRYRAKNKTLLRVSHLKQHLISQDLIEEIYGEALKYFEKTDLVIFSDFNYGSLPQSLVDRLINYCKLNKIPYVADSQSSSQTGDISRFPGSLLITPTEREARLAMMDNESGLVVLANRLITKSNVKHCILTLGEEGILIHSPNEEQCGRLVSDQIEALNSFPKDVSGAGDSLLICSSMALTLGATIWEAAYLGSVAAACQVGRIGNIPLNVNELLVEFKIS
jgi:rfaE bifunctional protein kinase chain/domain